MHTQILVIEEFIAPFIRTGSTAFHFFPISVNSLPFKMEALN